MVALPKDGLTLAEASAECGLSPITLRTQIRNGRLAAVKVGPVWVISQAELRRYLEKRAPQGQRSSNEIPVRRKRGTG